MILTDELCDKLCQAAKEKSQEVGIDISFAVCDENGLPRVYRRYGDALVLSITLVPGKAYTAAVTQCKTKDVAAAAAEGASLMAIQSNDPRITLVAGGYPLFHNGKIAGGLGGRRRYGGTRLPHCRACGIRLSFLSIRRNRQEDLNACPGHCGRGTQRSKCSWLLHMQMAGSG